MVSLTEAEVPADIALNNGDIQDPHHIKEWMVSLTETKTLTDMVLWVMETYKSSHHIKEWMVSLTETKTLTDIALWNM